MMWQIAEKVLINFQNNFYENQLIYWTIKNFIRYEFLHKSAGKAFDLFESILVKSFTFLLLK